MREFVQADLIDFLFRQTLEQRARNQDHRIEEPDRDRHVDVVADAQTHLTRTFVGGGPAGHRVAVLDRQRQRVAFEAFQPYESDRQPREREQREQRPNDQDAECEGKRQRHAETLGNPQRGRRLRGRLYGKPLRGLRQRSAAFDSAVGAAVRACVTMGMGALTAVSLTAVAGDDGTRNGNVVATGTTTAAISVALHTR